MLVNKVSAFNAVVPKDVLSGTKEENFKTKPMGYDSVSFGMAKVPELAQNGEDYLFQRIINFDREGFISAIRNYTGKDKSMLYNALTREFCIPSSYSNCGGTNSAMGLLRFKNDYESADCLTAITDAFGRNKPEDNKMLAELMLQFSPLGEKSSSLYVETIKRLASGAEGVSDSLSARLIVRGLENNFIAKSDLEDYGYGTTGEKLFVDVSHSSVQIKNKYDRTPSERLFFDIARFGSTKFFTETIKEHSGDTDVLNSLLTKKFNNYGNGDMTVFELALTKEDDAPLKAIINSFDKKDPEHNKMLAKLFVSAKAPRQMDYKVKDLYRSTVHYLALDCEDVPNDLSIKLIDKILETIDPERLGTDKYALNLKASQRWLAENGQN